MTEAVIEIWWKAMAPFDLAAIRDALNRHCMNPDNGQFCPKPADVVRLIEGGTVDASLVAWTKVDRAVRSIGTYDTVAFDDPIIHAVVSDMGGWIEFGRWTESEWPFKAKEFETRYRRYRIKGKIETYPGKLLGRVDLENGDKCTAQLPRLIGNPELAAQVVKQGADGNRLQIAPPAVAQKLLAGIEK